MQMYNYYYAVMKKTLSNRIVIVGIHLFKTLIFKLMHNLHLNNAAF